MCRWLEAGGYRVTTVATAEEALNAMAANPPAVALCDIRMPGHDGLWLAEQIRRTYPDTAVIMASGVHDVRVEADSARQGAVAYLAKPFGRDRLREAVVRGLEWHRSARDTRRWREALEEELTVRCQRLADGASALQVGSDGALEALLTMLTRHDREAYAHAGRVAALAVRVARALGVPEHEVAAIEHGALLHDIGKLAIPGSILRKPTPLTLEEQALMRRHPVIGSELLASLPHVAAAAPLVRAAQERMDGLGYPDAVPASEVALGARIIAVADAYDTMIHPRVFRDAVAPPDALLELERCSGTQFDPAVVATVARVTAEG